jgi:mono/diheme cytochrome c family protein
MRGWLLGIGFLMAGGVCASFADNPRPRAENSAAARGRAALLGRAFSPPVASRKAYDELWKQWGLKEKPADYDRALRERYGLHPAPYANVGRLMGFREAGSLLGTGITNDCMLCHAGSICGQSYVGLPNASLDLQGLYEDLLAASGFKDFPLRFSNVRGTIEATAAVAYLMQVRDDDLNLRAPVKVDYCETTCEDIPAWWLLKKKKTMYHSGATDTRAVRSMLTFMLSPLQSGATIKKQEPTFADIKAFLRTLEPPKYPFPVDAGQAALGKTIFGRTCARCHGTYGPGGSYPNKIVPLDVIGTDSTLLTAYSPQAAEHFLRSWFGQEKAPDRTLYNKLTHGYQAPPLDGIWASAPYFHNGSAPTVYHVLNSRVRPKVFTRSYRTEKEDYDPVKLGWKVTVLEHGPDATVPPRERRKIYDTTQPGRANTGHPFGDKLTEAERMAVIEYLKTI